MASEERKRRWGVILESARARLGHEAVEAILGPLRDAASTKHYKDKVPSEDVDLWFEQQQLVAAFEGPGHGA